MLMVSFICNLYYNILLAWSLYYVFASWQRTVPWSHCGHSYNTASAYHCSEIPRTILIDIFAFFSYMLCFCDFSVNVTDRGRPVRLPQFARLSPTEPIRGCYQSGRRRHIPVVPRRRPLPTRGPAPVWCLHRRRRPPLRSEERDAHHPLLFPSLDDAAVRFPIELIIRLLSVGLVVFSLRIGIYLPYESG